MTRRRRAPAGSTWHDVAVKHREALAALGWPVPHCLPGEAGACGGSDAEHAASYLGALQAVVESRIAHLHGGGEFVDDAYAQMVAVLAELGVMRPCGREH